MAHYKWTVAIIVQQDGEHLFEYVDLEQSILDQKFNNEIRYIIFYYDQNSGKNCIKQLKYNQKTKANEFEKIRKWVKEDIYAPQTFIHFFQEYVLKDAISDHTMIILWGHGAGLGYFYSLEKNPTKSNFLYGIEDKIDFLDREQRDEFNDDLNALVYFQSQFSFLIRQTDAIDDRFENYLNEKYKLNIGPTEDFYKKQMSQV